jgi:hypothetical protein
MRKPTIWFWVVAILFLVWNMIGCYFYIIEVTMPDAQYAEAHGAEMAAVRGLYPTWALAAFALAVWGGLLAATLLLLRKALSVPLFLVSLVMSVLCFIPNFVVTELREAAGSTVWVMPLIVIVIGVTQLWFSRRERARGTLR